MKMGRMDDAPSRSLRDLSARLQQQLEKARTLEDAAQTFVSGFYDANRDSVVLVRLFVTLRLSELPGDLQDFARGLARKAAIDLGPDAFVLTLLGTAGENAEWRQRRRSTGHQAIPLASPDFVAAIPMMSALLEQLGFDLGWIRGEPEIVASKIGQMSGTFYVEDAATAVDSQNRKIIAAEAFVRQHGVKSVLGFGGGYAIGGRFVVTICFLRETITKATAVRFQSFANDFKAKTGAMASDSRRIFA
jgi:hypothetical protein